MGLRLVHAVTAFLTLISIASATKIGCVLVAFSHEFPVYANMATYWLKPGCDSMFVVSSFTGEPVAFIQRNPEFKIIQVNVQEHDAYRWVLTRAVLVAIAGLSPAHPRRSDVYVFVTARTMINSENLKNLVRALPDVKQPLYGGRVFHSPEHNIDYCESKSGYFLTHSAIERMVSLMESEPGRNVSDEAGLGVSHLALRAGVTLVSTLDHQNQYLFNPIPPRATMNPDWLKRLDKSGCGPSGETRASKFAVSFYAEAEQDLEFYLTKSDIYSEL